MCHFLNKSKVVFSGVLANAYTHDSYHGQLRSGKQELSSDDSYIHILIMQFTYVIKDALMVGAAREDPKKGARKL